MTTITYLDHCLPDYFQGSSEEVIAVPVENTTTFRELRDDIKSEYNSYDGKDYADFDAALQKLFDGICNGVWHGQSMDSPAFPDIEPYGDDPEEDVTLIYAYFSISD